VERRGRLRMKEDKCTVAWTKEKLWVMVRFGVVKDDVRFKDGSYQKCLDCA